MTTRSGYQELGRGRESGSTSTLRALSIPKTVVCDDQVATVGTVNFDFRSLYLHFECGVWMYRTKATEAGKGRFSGNPAKLPGDHSGGLQKGAGIPPAVLERAPPVFSVNVINSPGLRSWAVCCAEAAAEAYRRQPHQRRPLLKPISQALSKIRLRRQICGGYER